jgi:hypothetical protein
MTAAHIEFWAPRPEYRSEPVELTGNSLSTRTYVSPNKPLKRTA